jgi:hypothetical protein
MALALARTSGRTLFRLAIAFAAAALLLGIHAPGLSLTITIPQAPPAYTTAPSAAPEVVPLQQIQSPGSLSSATPRTDRPEERATPSESSAAPSASTLTPSKQVVPSAPPPARPPGGRSAGEGTRPGGNIVSAWDETRGLIDPQPTLK